MSIVRIGSCAGLLLLVPATGCVMPDQVAQIQKDLADVRQQLRRSAQAQAETERKLADMESRQSSDSERVIRGELADLTVTVEEAGRESAMAQARMDDLDRRMDELFRELQRARRAPPRSQDPAYYPERAAEDRTADEPAGTSGLPEAGPPLPGGGALPDPESLYNTAYADFSKGNYALAISGFEEYQERFPNSSMADNALYWIGECHFSQGNFPHAIAAFDRLLETYPKSDRAPAGNLKKALAYLEQNQIGQAIVQLRYVMSTFPGSDEAKIARDKLTSLGAPI